jgi:molybdopterin/thiamine biosynthesis adenylyltransferase
MSFESSFPDHLTPEDPVLRLQAPGFPPPLHPAEPDLFCRQEAMPGHRQTLLEAARIAVVGCGGLGSWIAMALARMGVRRLVLIDPDRFDRSNAPRQMVTPPDLYLPKAHALARHVVTHMVNAGEVIGVAKGVREAIHLPTGDVTALVVGVDNNDARLAASCHALDRNIPAAFCMLSADGVRVQVLLQKPGGPCLRCLLPNLDPEGSLPCAAASMAGCLLAAAHAVHVLTHHLMKGSPIGWRESSLDGATERVGRPNRRPECSCRHGR